MRFQKIAALGQTAAAILGVCTALPLILFPATVLRLAGAQEEVVAIAAGYLQLFAAAAPLTVMSAVTTATFSVLGNGMLPTGGDTKWIARCFHLSAIRQPTVERLQVLIRPEQDLSGRKFA